MTVVISMLKEYRWKAGSLVSKKKKEKEEEEETWEGKR